MYADDMVPLAPSCKELQEMISLCMEELKILDLKLNVAKTLVLRIGKRCNDICTPIKIDKNDIQWAKEAKYLGIHIVNAQKFKCNFDKTKAKYYRAANAILGKLGKANNPCVTVQLMSSIALPILTYSMEAMSLSNTQIEKLGHPWVRKFMKLFSTFDNKVIQQCQLYTNMLPMHRYYVIRKVNFLNNLLTAQNHVLQTLHDSFGKVELLNIAVMLKCDVNILTKTFRP